MKATRRRAVATLAAAALATPLLLASASPATADRHTPGQRDASNAAKLAAKLVKKSSADDAFDHLEKFQQISDTTGNRAAGTLGYDASAAYVFKELKKYGYNVSYQPFTFPYIETQAESLAVVSPAPRTVGVVAMDYTKSTPAGGITADLAAVPADATTGCEPADYASGTYTGKIALIKRGGCTFAQKQATAADAGAIGALIYNNIEGSMGGTLGDPAGVKIPTGGIVLAEGEKFAAELVNGPVRVTMDVRQLQETRTTRNIIAETKHGNAANTVVLGAHLDSVSEGAGINDNGSGSAGLLEVAEQLAKAEKRPTNKIRFAWWGAEENGLLGSEAYVASLTSLGKKEIKAYLNFDMIASPNYGIFLYDGDDSDGVGAGPGPEGSAQIERDMQKFLDGRGTPHEGTDFSGRSDYGPFIEIGIPAGGTFTGAEVKKTEAQAAKFGGTAGVAYDPNYHGAGDNLDNVSMKAFGINIGIIANAVGTYAHDISSLSKPVTPAGPNGGQSGSGGLRDGHAVVTE